MLEHAIYSVISPEGCATILWRDVNQRRKAAAAFKPTARFCYELGVVDTVVPEPSGGAHKDHERAAQLLGDAIAQALDSIEAEPIELRRALRRAKFRRMGVWLENGVVVGEKEPEPRSPAAGRRGPTSRPSEPSAQMAAREDRVDGDRPTRLDRLHLAVGQDHPEHDQRQARARPPAPGRAGRLSGVRPMNWLAITSSPVISRAICTTECMITLIAASPSPAQA